jgi:hypothetical protein
MAMVVDPRRPSVLIVSEHEGILLGHDVADPGRGVRFRVGAVADDFMNRLVTGGRPPLPGRLGHRSEGLSEPDRTLGVLPDESLPLSRAHGRPSRARWSWLRWLSSWAAMSATQSP